MISVNAIIFSNYMIGEVYCENRSTPENILFIRQKSGSWVLEKTAQIEALYEGYFEKNLLRI